MVRTFAVSGKVGICRGRTRSCVSGDHRSRGSKPDPPREVEGSGHAAAAAAAAKSLQSCPTLCDPIDGSPPGSPVPGILQARALEWVAIAFSGVGMGEGRQGGSPLTSPASLSPCSPPTPRYKLL